MKVLDLFSGIGGFSLGLERAGMTTVAFCEVDKSCRQTLARHWPYVPCYEDVKTLSAERLRADRIAVDLICGGFPCQGISTAGQHLGLGDDRSGLWTEFARLIGELRPKYAIVENVGTLARNGLGRVLGDLAEIGFDADWDRIPASAVGAPHRRDRIWIVAYPQGAGGRAHTGSMGESPNAGIRSAEGEGDFLGWSSEFARLLVGRGTDRRGTAWEVEPGVGRMADGVPHRLDRQRRLGNAVVPQIPEIIGRAIMTVTQSCHGSER